MTILQYTIRHTQCDCHPQTCCCNPFEIVKRDGSSLVKLYREEIAIEIAIALNIQHFTKMAVATYFDPHLSCVATDRAMTELADLLGMDKTGKA